MSTRSVGSAARHLSSGPRIFAALTLRTALLALAFVAGFFAGSRPGEAAAAPPDLATPQQIEDAFLRALRLMESGDPRSAVILLRQILARDPNLPRVRLELARAYFLMESWPEARTEFVAVLSSDVPQAVKKNILRFINAIDSRRGFDWNAAIGFAFNPEATRRYKSDTVTLDFFGTKLPFKVERDDNKAFGAKFDGSAELRQKLISLGDEPAVVGFLGGAANIFEARGTDADDYIFSATAGSRLLWPQTTAVAAVSASVRYKHGEVYEDRQGISLAAESRTADGLSRVVSASYSDVNVHDNDAQDGDLFSLGFGVSKSLFGTADLGAFAAVQHFDAEESHEAYDSGSITLRGRADLGGGFGVSPAATIRFTTYKETAPLFLDSRNEKQFDFDIEVVKNDVFVFGKFSPFAQIGYTHNDSSINIYTYDEYRFFAGIKNAF